MAELQTTSYHAISKGGRASAACSSGCYQRRESPQRKVSLTASGTIAIVVGTRPELIKTAPVIHELRRRGVSITLIHTGQHYTRELDDVFFEDLDLPEPSYNLAVGSLPAPQQLAQIISRSADVLEAIHPRIVLVQGDTNSVLGGALAAHKLGIPVAHLEAGLRSDDWSMPEEGNRVLTDRISALLFCPTDLQARRLAAEAITDGVYVVGNTIVDAALHYSRRAQTASKIIDRLGLHERRYALITLHRPSNVDDDGRLALLLEAFRLVGLRRGLAMVFPVHPRTAARLHLAHDGRSLDAAPFVACEPVSYLDLLQLLVRADCVLTDSGGIQEEACTLHVPCITLRQNTERPETIEVGANVLCDTTDPEGLDECIRLMLDRPRDWQNPLGDGHTAERVVDIMLAAIVRPSFTGPTGPAR